MDKLQDKIVLIVDDEDSNIYALSSYLESLDMKVMVAKNGEDMMSVLGKGAPPHIILLDMMMPVMDGFEALEALKLNDLYKKIPAIAVTAKAMKGDKERCIEAGAWDYIAKPLDLKLLVEKLKHWIA
jgi:CheY-like chemotaxis protein